MDYEFENNAHSSSDEEDCKRLKNKENAAEDSDDDSSENEVVDDGKDIDEIKQVVSSDEEDSESDEEEDEEEEDVEQNSQSAQPRTYIPKIGKKNDKLVVDESAYVLLVKAKTNYPCLSFDIINDSLGDGEDRSTNFPLSMSMVGGTYSGGKANADSLIVMKFSKLFPGSKNSPQNVITEQQNNNKEGATLRYVKIPHSGSINRIRCKNISK